MRRRMVLFLAGALVLIAAAVGWWQSRPRLTDEEKILAVIAEVRAAAEERNAGRVLRHIDDDYDDGTYKKLDLTRMVVGGFRSPEPWRVQVELPQVQVTGDRATAKVRVEVWFAGAGSDSDHVRAKVTADFVKRRGSWKVIRAGGWEPVATLGE